MHHDAFHTVTLIELGSNLWRHAACGTNHTALVNEKSAFCVLALGQQHIARASDQCTHVCCTRAKKAFVTTCKQIELLQ
jgi:hypothetical protein